MKRIRVLPIAVAVGAMVAVVVGAAALTMGGGSAGRGRPDITASVEAAVWSQPAWSPAAPTASGSAGAVAGCAMARALDSSSAIGDFAIVGIELSKAQDGVLAEAGIRLAREAMKPAPSRTAVYARYLDVMAECLRVSP